MKRLKKNARKSHACMPVLWFLWCLHEDYFLLRYLWIKAIHFSVCAVFTFSHFSSGCCVYILCEFKYFLYQLCFGQFLIYTILMLYLLAISMNILWLLSRSYNLFDLFVSDACLVVCALAARREYPGENNYHKQTTYVLTTTLCQ